MDKRETQLCNMYTYIIFYAKLYSLLGRGRLYEARISYYNNNNNFIYPRYYFTIKIEYLQKKQLSDRPIGRAHANI